MTKQIRSSLGLMLVYSIILFSCNSALIQPDGDLSPLKPVAQMPQDTTPRVTGIGGIFFKSEVPEKTSEWYGKHLGLVIDPYGSPFEFRNSSNPEKLNYLRWAPFQSDTDYFDPSDEDFMINYRVQNIQGLVRNLEHAGVVILDSIATYPYGKFVHLLDHDGRKIELWEPVDSFFTAMNTPTTK